MDFLGRLASHPSFVEADVHTGFIEVCLCVWSSWLGELVLVLAEHASARIMTLIID